MSVLLMKWNKITVLTTIPTFHQYLVGVDNKLAKKFENNVGMELPELPKEMPPLTEMVASYMVRLTNLSTRVFYVLKFFQLVILIIGTCTYLTGCTVICTLQYTLWEILQRTILPSRNSFTLVSLKPYRMRSQNFIERDKV